MALTRGDKIPHFSAPTQDGQRFDSRKALEEGALVLFFYPKDYTPGCTAEACNFRDDYQEFRAEGATVVGISRDSPRMHKRFANSYQLPYALLTDKNGELAKKFGIKNHFFNLIPGRATFVIDSEGIVQWSYSSQNASQHHLKALEALKNMKEL